MSLKNNIDVAICTFMQTANNQGQVLQAYALQKFIKNNYPYLIVKNFNQNDFNWHFYQKKYIDKKYDKLSQKGKIQADKFNEFKQKYLTFEKENFIAKAYICGSDQIWNNYERSLDDARLDLNYFTLEFAKKLNPEARTFSYAPSFGRVEFGPEFIEFFKENLSKLDDISVREKANLDNLEEWGLKGQVVCDPTLLLSANEWNEIAENFNSKDKIFFYSMRPDTYIKIQDIYNEFGKNNAIFTFANQGASDTDYTSYPSPQEFLGGIRDAKCVITNSFHCTCFCVIFHTPFFMLASTDEAQNERQKTLLSFTGLDDFIIRDKKEIDFEKFKNIDWENVDIKLQEFRKRGVEFLKNNLKDL
ncbi:polysaccharide pyruvyl transferase family protein [Campylobacter devanensis]|uniref:polysaccharide pyruvyl transferase family protein n=1 Tax=Campylobacter devanensis TaxID=3161138 RepID=UPI000A3574F9|nr:polysaccharide pyruvyl transferase family protein [Campylobacter sp. P148]